VSSDHRGGESVLALLPDDVDLRAAEFDRRLMEADERRRPANFVGEHAFTPLNRFIGQETFRPPGDGRIAHRENRARRFVPWLIGRRRAACRAAFKAARLSWLPGQPKIGYGDITISRACS
jgi:hypothetical protein